VEEVDQNCKHLSCMIQLRFENGEWYRLTRCIEEGELVQVEEIKVPFVLKAYVR
jgi:hypothetical protein